MLIVFALTTEELQDRNSRIEALLAEMARGESASVGLLYDLVKTDVFAYALSKLGNKHDAEDIMQDTFVRVYECAGQYRPQGKPMAWMIRIELNLIRRHLQLQSRTEPFDERFDSAPSGENVEDSFLNNAFLAEMMKRLTAEEREVVTLHVVSGMKHRETAKLLHKPLSTVLSKYNRAIKKLQAVVKEEE